MMYCKRMIFLGLIGLTGVINSAQATAPQGQANIHAESIGDFVIAREASEGPRGGDRERPGDRQRRGGKHAVGFEPITTATLDTDLIAREASSGGRGKDDRRPHR